MRRLILPATLAGSIQKPTHEMETSEKVGRYKFMMYGKSLKHEGSGSVTTKHLNL